MTLLTVLLIIAGYFLFVTFICKFFGVATKTDELDNPENLEL
jgi:hypothetical protein